MGKRIRLKQAAESLGVSTFTLRKYADKGLVRCYRTPSGQRVFDEDDLIAFDRSVNPVNHDESDNDDHERVNRVVFYVRSSTGDDALIESQVSMLTAAYGEPVLVYKDKASGLNENRKGFWRLVSDAGKGEFDTVCITARDRLTRFGYRYVEQLLGDRGVSIRILDDKDTSTVSQAHEELMRDFMSLIASFSGRFYKLRGVEQRRRLLKDAEARLGE